MGLVQSCSLVIAVIALKLAPPTPLPQYYPQMMTLSSPLIGQVEEPAPTLCHLLNIEKDLRLPVSYSEGMDNGAPTRKRKLTTDVSIW